MAHEIRDRLRAALADRYEVGEEIGRGGMATVYRADDLRHGRHVAIKVLRPELAAALGQERFQREIAVAATLNHPHVLPLHDSGEADTLLFYVMPFVEGESLRDRLRRETQLSVTDAVAITRQVADALAYAHDRGIVHRDIKPENIMLSGQHAVVTDFGIARVFDAEDVARLTSTGMAIGTPSYMSPEQIAGDSTLDRRADIYALGCVLYEMLMGEPPFGGPTAQVIMARHAVERVPSMRAVRETIPEPVEGAVRTALAKTPADRFPTAREFIEALDVPLNTTTPAATAARPPGRRGQVLRWALPLAAVLLGLAAVLQWVPGPKGGVAVASDAELVAIMPFRLVGVVSPATASLVGGIPELLYVRLTGDPGPRAVSPATVNAALAGGQMADRSDLSLDDAIETATRLRAGRVLVGQVVATGEQVVISATLHAVPDGREVARTSDITGPTDSLLQLVDRLTVELLLQGAGAGQGLGDVVTTDFTALRAYLAGKAAFDRGRFAEAGRQFGAALDADSSFALAALGLATASRFFRNPGERRGLELAWAARDRLGPRDRVYLTALAGPRYPAASSERARLYAWETAVDAHGDRLEARHLLGEALFHSGPWLGIAGLEQRAAAAFRRALDLDSMFAPAIAHLLDIAAVQGDTATVRRLAGRYFAIDSVGDLADFYRWRVAAAFADTATLAQVRARFPTMSPSALERIIAIAQLDGTGMGDAVLAAGVLRDKSVSSRDVRWAYVKLREVALNRGRPLEAARIITEFRGAEPTGQFDALGDVVEALYWGADGARAAAVVGERVPSADAPVPPGASAFDGRYFDICGVSLWRLAHGEYATIPAAIAKLRRVPRPLDEFQTGYIEVCASVLETRLAAALGRPEVTVLLDHLDSLAQSGPQSTSWLVVAANLTVAELREAQGHLPAALAAARRRVSQYELGEPRVLVALATFLREEGRLAALTGDRVGAIRAYAHYLALRDDPEPSVAPEVERVRTALEHLRSGTADR
ncbi:MAG: serine/threonine protein kinase [Gemmatimonadota bacterium]|nr:serine/threonine protein kinase [Gemmatimonadota bacterium]